jgi:hypothetical protein
MSTKLFTSTTLLNQHINWLTREGSHEKVLKLATMLVSKGEEGMNNG